MSGSSGAARVSRVPGPKIRNPDKNVGALGISTGFLGILYHTFYKEPPKRSIGNDLGPVCAPGARDGGGPGGTLNPKP